MWTSATRNFKWLLLAALVLAAVPARAEAPGTYGVATQATCKGANKATVTITVSSASLVVAWAFWHNSSQTGSMTDSAAQTYSVATGPTTNTTEAAQAEMFYVANSAALTSVSFSPSGGGSSCTLIVAAYTGMATTGTLDVANSQFNSASSTTCTTPSVTTTNASDVIIGACAPNLANTASFTAGGSGCTYTIRETNPSGSGLSSALEDCNTTATGSFTGTMTLSASADNIGAVAAFKQAPPPSACPKTLLTLGVGC